MKKFLSILAVFACFLLSCSQPDDGPISVYPDGMHDRGEGYVLKARIDSGRVVHLRKDTLKVELDSLWTLANCFLRELRFDESVDDTTLSLFPVVRLKMTDEDCATPPFHPETTLFLLPNDSWKNYREVRVYNTDGRLEDSIAMRSGKFLYDTLKIYLDSTFKDYYSLPRRTEGLPSVMRSVDSLKERTFYWRSLPSRCEYIIDTCETVADTAYPKNWSLRDTNLVPIRKECKDSTERYCLARDWVYDSTALGDVQTRLDTLWYTSWYLVLEIPKCGVINKANYGGMTPKTFFKATQEIFDPESDKECFSGIASDRSVMRLDSAVVMPDPDSILAIFDTASVGRDSVGDRVDDVKQK